MQRHWRSLRCVTVYVLIALSLEYVASSTCTEVSSQVGVDSRQQSSMAQVAVFGCDECRWQVQLGVVDDFSKTIINWTETTM